jgi:hypothetical protein
VGIEAHSFRRYTKYNQTARIIHRRTIRMPITHVGNRGSEINPGVGVELGVTVGVRVLEGVRVGVRLAY